MINMFERILPNIMSIQRFVSILTYKSKKYNSKVLFPGGGTGPPTNLVVMRGPQTGVLAHPRPPREGAQAEDQPQQEQ